MFTIHGISLGRCKRGEALCSCGQFQLAKCLLDLPCRQLKAEKQWTEKHECEAGYQKRPKIDGDPANL